eukprot:CAMPEP_0114542186 /NCGR_PEP_ID=MMETSP0114-20121206/1706_1 /TAXON_ID=31324 /ORGANISM="Goniomonas sp, Strain m" /LENGTH=58 /DNA_ID=CAMNT_0001726477 /DNA_START=18 /DNA_END=194 /DNA_ORIENTATION=+
MGFGNFQRKPKQAGAVKTYSVGYSSGYQDGLKAGKGLKGVVAGAAAGYAKMLSGPVKV